MLPEKLAEAYGDMNLPDVGEVSSGVKGNAKGRVNPERPGHREGAELGGEDGGREVGDNALS
jgi:hypothetical protein